MIQLFSNSIAGSKGFQKESLSADRFSASVEYFNLSEGWQPLALVSNFFKSKSVTPATISFDNVKLTPLGKTKVKALLEFELHMQQCLD
jgi:hypothetical protein